MKRFRWLTVTAAITALAACKGGDEVNMADVEVNAADENLALPPVDMNADMSMTNGMNDTNAVDTTNNTADNTVNAY